MGKTVLGVIVGNRDFFPDSLCVEGRDLILRVLAEEGFESVCLAPEMTKGGSIETYQDALLCAELFRKNADRIDGILVTLPNFGDEKAIAEAIRRSGLQVPVLVHAFPDEGSELTVSRRRDSFCGKISVCNNLMQYGIPYSLTDEHTCDPSAASFRRDLRRFGAVCRIVKGLEGLRIGAIGARPAAFNTVRCSEKLLERYGITVQTVDLSEIIGKAERLRDDEAVVREKLQAIQAYVPTQGVPDASLKKIARLGAAIDTWMQENDLQASAIQCWNALEGLFGVVPCTAMSMMSNNLLPSACEVDVTGALAMVILQLASGQPSALVDWNNNYQSEPDKCVIFHCSNLPREMLQAPKMEYAPILASTLGQQNTYGTISGRIRPGRFTFARVSTDDLNGVIRAYTGEGEISDAPLATFGGYGVVHVPDLQRLLQYICRQGFEHHVAINLSESARAVAEALELYLGWEVYHHGECAV